MFICGLFCIWGKVVSSRKTYKRNSRTGIVYNVGTLYPALTADKHSSLEPYRFCPFQVFLGNVDEILNKLGRCGYFKVYVPTDFEQEQLC